MRVQGVELLEISCPRGRAWPDTAAAVFVVGEPDVIEAVPDRLGNILPGEGDRPKFSGPVTTADVVVQSEGRALPRAGNVPVCGHELSADSRVGAGPVPVHLVTDLPQIDFVPEGREVG